MSRNLALYFLAYVQEFGQNRTFNLLIMDGNNFPEGYEGYLANLNVTTISLDQATTHRYKKIFLQPYQNFATHKELLNNFSFESISYFSDALRNGMYSFPSLDLRADELIYFGFELYEKSFYENLDSKQKKMEKKIVSPDMIRKVWVDMTKLSNRKKSSSLKSDDLLIAMRHWGTKPTYTFGEEGVHRYLEEEFAELPPLKRIILRDHPWVGPNSLIRESLLNLTSSHSGLQLFLWEDLFPVQEDFSELSSPEGEFWNNDHELGYFFGFDGSLNNLLQICSPKTQVIYPNFEIFEKYFHYKKTTDLVAEQVRWQKVYAQKISQGNISSEIRIETDGRGYEKLITEIGIWSGDALTQERDALMNSTIWKLSWPIRWTINQIKRIVSQD